MYLIRGQHNLKLFKLRYPEIPLCGTIGNFDGLHLGHQAILKKIQNRHFICKGSPSENLLSCRKAL